MDRWSFRQPLLRFFPDDKGPSPWMLKPVLSTMICSGFWGDNRQLIFGLIVLPLRDRIVWSGTFNLSFINWNIEVTKPSVCRRGRSNMNLRDCMVSMAWSEKRCCPPLLLVVHGFQDFMTEDDIQRVEEPRLHKDCSYSFQLLTLYFFFELWITTYLCNSFITSSIWMLNVIQQIYLCTNTEENHGFFKVKQSFQYSNQNPWRKN